MHVAHADAVLVQIFGEVLRHALGQRGDERAIARCATSRHFAHEIVDLLRAGRISTGGSMRPVGRMTCSTKTPPVCSISHFAGRRRDMHRLRPHRVPFLEAQGAVVEAGRQAEAVFGERRLAAEVAAIHAADLRHGDVALVGEDERVVGQIFEQGRRRLAGFAAGEIARIILDAGAGRRWPRSSRDRTACAVRAAALRAGGPCGVSSCRRPLQLVLDALDRPAAGSGAASRSASWRRPSRMRGRCVFLPVSGSNSAMLSISSPKRPMRQARSS